MSLEFFQLINDTTIVTPICKSDFIKIYHHQGEQLIVSDRNNEFIFGENINYHQNGNAYLQYDKAVRKVALTAAEGDHPNQLDPHFFDNEESRLVKIAFA